MTTHRPHPITGPWPYANRRADPEYVKARGADRVGPLTLTDRAPVEDSKIYDDPEDALLFDDCERCDEHARHLVSLDPDKFAALWLRMVEVEQDSPDYVAAYRTNAEAIAGLALYRMATLIQRSHPGIDPWRWPWTFRVAGIDVAGFPLNDPWHLDPDNEGIARG